MVEEIDRQGLLEQLREDYRAHSRGWDLPGFHAVMVLRFGKWTHRVPFPFRKLVRVYYKIAFIFVRNVYGIEMIDTIKLGRRVLIGHQHGIVIHPNAEIGDECVIRQGCTIGAATVEGWSRQVPRLGKRVMMGAGSAVLGAVVIGDDVRIGPNAVVVTSIPAGSIVVADAPRIIKPRPKDVA
jgi:serine O-acetyltransferase